MLEGFQKEDAPAALAILSKQMDRESQRSAEKAAKALDGKTIEELRKQIEEKKKNRS